MVRNALPRRTESTLSQAALHWQQNVADHSRCRSLWPSSFFAPLSFKLFTPPA
jgi:hypothetical protein